MPYSDSTWQSAKGSVERIYISCEMARRALFLSKGQTSNFDIIRQWAQWFLCANTEANKAADAMMHLKAHLMKILWPLLVEAEFRQLLAELWKHRSRILQHHLNEPITIHIDVLLHAPSISLTRGEERAIVN